MLDSTVAHSSTSAAGQMSTLRVLTLPSIAVADSRAVLERLIASSHDDLGRLARILREPGGYAVLRGIDGTAFAVVAKPSPSTSALLDAAHTLRAPIRGANGDLLAFLEVIAATDGSDVSRKLLSALTDSVARSISERWFRVTYRQQWIVAAQGRFHSERLITLAVDRQRQIVGADHEARELLEMQGRKLDSHLALSVLFQIPAGGLFSWAFRDEAVTLVAAADGALWSALITPPDHGADLSGQSERVLLHARPRLGELTAAELPLPRVEASRTPSLSPRLLRRVREYIDGHLESALSVSELARTLGISISCFSRCFRIAMGLTPHGYVMRRRLIRAQELLAQTDLAVVDIASATGFSDQSHFCRRFHQLTGLTPRAFRTQHR